MSYSETLTTQVESHRRQCLLLLGYARWQKKQGNMTLAELYARRAMECRRRMVSARFRLKRARPDTVGERGCDARLAPTDRHGERAMMPNHSSADAGNVAQASLASTRRAASDAGDLLSRSPDGPAQTDLGDIGRASGSHARRDGREMRRMHRSGVPAAAAGAVLIASCALAQLPDPRPPVTVPPDDMAALSIPAMTACLDAMRHTGTRTAIAAGVSCTVGITTHPERVSYCQFRPADGNGLPLLELFSEPATYVRRLNGPAGGSLLFTYDAAVATTLPSDPAARINRFFAHGRIVASLRLVLTPWHVAFDDAPADAPGYVQALLSNGNAVREACFALARVS